MCALLDRARISYVFQSSMWDERSGTVYIADFRIRRRSIGRPKGMPRKEWKRQFKGLEKLFVEIDGGYHQNRQQYDERRTRWMESHRNAIVLRFSNEFVLANGADIIAAIKQYGPVLRTVRPSLTSRAPERDKRTLLVGSGSSQRLMLRRDGRRYPPAALDEQDMRPRLVKR